MRKYHCLSRLFISTLPAAIILSFWIVVESASAQEVAPPPPREPVMKSIFWNTVYGSGWGAIVGTMAALSGPDVPFRDSLILGTTAGGIVGYGVGVLLVLKGVSFNPSVLPVPTTEPVGNLPSSTDDPIALFGPPLLSTEQQRAQNSQKPNGWTATVYATKF